MTHTETIHESARHLKSAGRCLASLASAMSETTNEKCREQIVEAIRYALGDVSRAGAAFHSAYEPVTS